MKFTPTPLPGMVEIEAEPYRDDRGHFARAYCPQEFAEAGIAFEPRQVNIAGNTTLHTLRGLHFQKAPHAESKLIRAIEGVVWDVAVDLRPGPGFGRWHGVTLDAHRMNAVFLPEGVGHGFITLTENATLLYHMGADYVPGMADGLPWNDPAFGIVWPAQPAVMSERDASWRPLASRDAIQP